MPYMRETTTTLIAKISMDVWVEVENSDKAEEACSTLNLGMGRAMEGFPAGEFVSADVRSWHEEKNPERFD
jgi:hypothetical protein